MITDEVIEAACTAYHKSGAATPYGKELMKAALEAAFNHLADVRKEIEKPNPKRLVNAIDVTGDKMKMPFDEVADYPFVAGFEELEPEYNQEDLHKNVFIELDEAQAKIHAIFKKYKKPNVVKPEDNQGWIELATPNMNETLEIKFADGTIAPMIAKHVNWHNSNIRAYRIKPNTVKPEKKTLLETIDEIENYKGEALPKDAFERREIYRRISEYMDEK